MSQNIVFFPKNTTLVAGTYYSEQFDVSEFKTVTTEVIYGGGLGTTPAISGQLQQSDDLTVWSNVGNAMAPASVANTPAQDSASNPGRYVRLQMTVTTGNATVTFWAKAVAREN